MIIRKYLVLIMAGILCNSLLFADDYKLVKISNCSEKIIIFCPFIVDADKSPFNGGNLNDTVKKYWANTHMQTVMIMPGTSWNISKYTLPLNKCLHAAFLKSRYEKYIGLYLFTSLHKRGNSFRFMPPAGIKSCALIIDKNGCPWMDGAWL